MTAAVIAAGCSWVGGMPDPAAPLTPPTTLCRQETAGPCREAAEVEALLRDPGLTVLGSDEPSEGIQGARILTLLVPRADGDVVFRAKWRANATRTVINSPRKELAAHEMQKLFLPVDDYVVPPASGHCFELDHYHAMVDAEAEPLENTRCVFGVLSYWLEDVQSLDDAEDDDVLRRERLYDPALFERNETYRRSLANVNLLAYLIRHGDTHPGQFVVTSNEEHPRVYSVDNSLSFGAPQNTQLTYEQNWSHIHVPALPQSSVERLRVLSKQDIARLGVFEQYEKRADLLVPVEPEAPRGDTEAAMRWVDDGRQLQLGLMEAEVAAVWERVGELLSRIGSTGEPELF